MQFCSSRFRFDEEDGAWITAFWNHRKYSEAEPDVGVEAEWFGRAKETKSIQDAEVTKDFVRVAAPVRAAAYRVDPEESSPTLFD